MAQVRTASQMEHGWGGTAWGESSQGWYKQQTISLLQGLHEEVDPAAMEHLQILCQRFELSRDAMSELLSTRDLTQVLQILLAHNGNQIHKLIIDLNEVVPKIIQDLKPEVRDKLLWLSETAMRENVYVEGNIHGREETMATLMSMLSFREDNSTKLVNVCGMPGIGKSFLVKHLMSRLVTVNTNVFYVNASDVTRLEDLKLQIFKQSFIPARFSSSDDVMSCFCNFLLLNKRDMFVLIIDDLSPLFDPGNKSCRPLQVLEFLNDITLKMFQSSVQFKMVVTSQSLLMTDESSEQPLLIPIKTKMKAYTRDLPISKLPDSDAVKFLGPTLQNLNDYDKERLVRLCDGHPLALHLMSELAITDFTHTTEVTHVSTDDVQAGVDTVLLDLFEKAFNKLSIKNRKILFAVILFDLGAPLRALHYITHSGESFEKFSEEMGRDFDSGFWLRMQKMAQRGTFVVLHHPLIKKFLSKKIASSSPADSHIHLALKRDFVTFHINKLISIGKECVPAQPYKPDFVQKSCSKFLQDQLNFKKAFYYIAELMDPFTLFSKDSDGLVMRSPSDVAHLFLCLCQFHDWFNGTMIHTLSELLHQTHSDSVEYRLLSQTLYATVLTISHNWDDLDEFLKPHNRHVDPSRIISTSRDLFSLCKALQAFASGALYAHKLKIKEVGLESLIEQKDKMLDEATKKLSLKHLADDWKRVRMYFCVHVLLVKANSVAPDVEPSVSTLQAAYSVCYQAKSKYISQVAILEPTVYSALAKYKANEGHLFRTDPNAASERYGHSASFFKDVVQLLKEWKMENSVTAARNYDDYASLMRSWGFVLVKAKSDERSEEATNMFTIAKEIGAKAISIWEHKTFCSSSMDDILTAYLNQASVFTNLAKYHHRRPRGHTVNRLKYAFQMQALKYYGEAYSLLKEDYRKCHLTVGDWRLQKLVLQLPFFMDCARNPPESIDKVKSNLQEIGEAVRGAAHQPLTLSGSEVYASTSDGYNSRSSDDMDYEETDSPSTTFSSSGVPALPSASSFRDTGSSAVGTHESKKRKL